MKTACPKLKLQSKTLWAGAYGGHYDIIVFFNKKPKLSPNKDRHGVSFYELIEQEKEIISGDMSLSQFAEIFPDADISALLDANNNNRPKECEIYEVIKVKIRWLFEDGKMQSIDCNSDGWTY